MKKRKGGAHGSCILGMHILTCIITCTNDMYHIVVMFNVRVHI